MDFSTILSFVSNYFVAFIFIISFIVFIHEFGHFWVARRFGVKIETFSIGFGKEIFGWNDKHGTRWSFSLIPLGGYVKMFGDSDAASTPDKTKIKEMSAEEKSQAFHYKPLYQRFLIVLAGPAANYILTAVILAIFFLSYGRPVTEPVISKLVKNGVAQAAGLKKGDIITEIDGKSVSSFEDLRGIVSMHPNIEIDLKYKRAGQVTEMKITPESQKTNDIFGNKVEVGVIGVISDKVSYKEMGLTESITYAVYQCYDLSYKTLQAVGQMITGERPADQISGILRIADYSAKSVEQGFRTVLWFIAILSLNLGLINLFPIPMLDGGHLFFYLIEGVRGKPISEKVQEYMFRFGFALLITLMLFATFNDLKHFNVF
ncbi:MAG TPA: RIP metalloprotease RseP [Alphaproteobacteria bacterium]|nr:RIP metalloprotease RseP [Alphaproteobacteria bacterium]